MNIKEDFKSNLNLNLTLPKLKPNPAVINKSVAKNDGF